MNETLIYKVFTIADLEDWLVNNKANGISDRIISRTRAYAFINNPHARKEDAVIAAVFDGDVAIGYTAAFAEKWVRPALSDRYFWGSTQWLEPEYRGKGASWNMMRQIKDAVGERYIALESTEASCKLDHKQGYAISYYPKYFLNLKTTCRSPKALLKKKLMEYKNKKAFESLNQYKYSNRHVPLIDEETYAFIVAHSEKDLFLRQRDYLNWQIHFPFLQAVDRRFEKKTGCEFGSDVESLSVQMAQVYREERLCGFYVLNCVNKRCKPLYLYYDTNDKEFVFASLLQNVFSMDLMQFSTFSKDLFDFMRNVGFCGMNSKHVVEQVSLTLPPGFTVDESLNIQGGDGDMVC